jgi:hypothetical protein
MWRAWRWVLVGGVGVLVLAGCGRSWFAERESWRREAEEACLKSGAVKESPNLAMIKSITGPGTCGADYPIKVTALGESFVSGYADELRPPGAIPGASAPRGYPANTPFSVNPDYPADTRLPARSGAGTVYRAPAAAPTFFEGPMPLTPPGIEPPGYDTPGGYATATPRYGAPNYDAPRPVQTQRIYQGAAPASTPMARRGYEVAPLDVPPTQPSAPANAPPRAATTVPLSPSRMPTGSVGPAGVTPAATLACPIVSALDRWVIDAVQPAALRWFAQPVVEIKQISAYSCRGMNGNPNAKISEHAFGNALDIASFRLADGHVVTVKGGWRGTPEEQGFLHDVQLAACEQFTTVLAPGSNVFHYDHIHVDLMRRASGRGICQPAAIPGEVVAARARARYATGRKGEPAYTGSITSYAPRRQARRAAPDQAADDDDSRGLPRAVAGED